jgi:16S rRNA A1518/A1519 N6-dimethyltransferase RsmA/KsgA/DIM1 with predicted DNA glycosylase/AP lyase activity
LPAAVKAGEIVDLRHRKTEGRGFFPPPRVKSALSRLQEMQIHSAAIVLDFVMQFFNVVCKAEE